MRLPSTLLFIVLLAVVLPARAEEPAQPGNAAVHYWCAAAVMKRPANDQEQKLLDYLEEQSFLPPKVFIERHDAEHFLQDDLSPGGTMDMLHVGAECPECDFEVEREIVAGGTLHADVLRKLARRGWAAVSVLEGQGDLMRAGELYADLLQFSAHLCQCPFSLYAASGDAVLEGSLGQFVPFLARKPGPEVLPALWDRFSRIPPNPLSFSRCTAFDAKTQPLDVKKAFSHTMDKELDERLEAYKGGGLSELALPLGGGAEKASLELLRSKNPEERPVIVENWMKAVGEELSALAKAGEGPMAESEPRVRAQIERMRLLAKPAADGNSPGCPLLEQWAEIASAQYSRFAYKNARWELARIICAAALFEAQTGRYPDSLKSMENFFPAGLPKDPYTGKDFLYTLEEGLPLVAAQPPDSLRKEFPRWQWNISMSTMVKRQDAFLERYRNESKSPPSPDRANH